MALAVFAVVGLVTVTQMTVCPRKVTYYRAAAPGPPEYLLIDNTTNGPVDARVAGSPAARIPAHSAHRVELFPGHWPIEVRAPDGAAWNDEITIPPRRNTWERRCAIYSVGGAARYGEVSRHYEAAPYNGRRTVVTALEPNARFFLNGAPIQPCELDAPFSPSATSRAHTTIEVHLCHLDERERSTCPEL